MVYHLMRDLDGIEGGVVLKTLRTTFLVLIALATVLAVACGESGEEAVVDPTPEPTVAPTSTPEPTPTPEPPPEPEAPAAPVAPDAPAMTFDVPELAPDATGQDIVDNLLSEEEATCVREAVGDEAYQGLLQANLLDPAADVTGEVLEPCLSKETTVLFFLAGFSAATGGMIADETLDCIGNNLLSLEADLLAAEPDPSVMFAFVPCLTPEEMAALTAIAPAPQ